MLALTLWQDDHSVSRSIRSRAMSLPKSSIEMHLFRANIRLSGAPRTDNTNRRFSELPPVQRGMYTGASVNRVSVLAYSAGYVAFMKYMML